MYTETTANKPYELCHPLLLYIYIAPDITTYKKKSQ